MAGNCDEPPAEADPEAEILGRIAGNGRSSYFEYLRRLENAVWPPMVRVRGLACPIPGPACPKADGGPGWWPEGICGRVLFVAEGLHGVGFGGAAGGEVGGEESDGGDGQRGADVG